MAWGFITMTMPRTTVNQIVGDSLVWDGMMAIIGVSNTACSNSPAHGVKPTHGNHHMSAVIRVHGLRAKHIRLVAA